MIKRGIVIGLVSLAAVFGLSACKEVDKHKAGATLVKGTSNLYWFCDGSTLIYFEDVEGNDDEYVALFSWGCDAGKPTKELPGVLGDGNGGDTGNGDK